jgi:hypothetical protein
MRIFIIFNILALSLIGCSNQNEKNSKSDSKSSIFYTNHYDENQKLYRLNWFQNITLKDVIIKEDNRIVTTETITCEDVRMIGKTPHSYDGHKQVTKTVVKGKFGKEYNENGKPVYLDVFSGTETYTNDTDCEEDDS